MADTTTERFLDFLWTKNRRQQLGFERVETVQEFNARWKEPYADQRRSAHQTKE